MVDREDDLKVGIKSTAILFGELDRHIVAALQILTVLAMILIGRRFELGWTFFASVAVAAGLFLYQQTLIRQRKPEDCFKAFLNNNWVGATIFAGIALDIWSRGGQ
jgi:4-hydroxybenzoate polyprenyltransferase